jgi:hypothetical protein
MYYVDMEATQMANTTWIIRDKKSLLVAVEETSLGQCGERDGAQFIAENHQHEFDNVIVRRDKCYGWRAFGQRYGATIKEVA